MKCNWLSLFLVLLLFSCLQERIPKGIIPKDKMVSLLVDQHLMEPFYTQRFALGIPDSTAKDDLYLSLLKKHKVTAKQFEESVYYYGKHPEIYKQIYSKVLDRLNEMDVAIKKENPVLKR